MGQVDSVKVLGSYDPALSTISEALFTLLARNERTDSYSSPFITQYSHLHCLFHSFQTLNPKLNPKA